MSKKMRILLIGSVLFNVLLLGIIIGQVSHRLDKEDFMRRHAPELAVKLPVEKKELFLKTMEQVHLNNRDIDKQMDETREKVINILTAPEFDEAAYRSEVQKLDSLRGLMMQRLEDATIELAKQFNQEERNALAEHLRHPPPPPLDRRPPHHERPPEFREGHSR